MAMVRMRFTSSSFVQVSGLDFLPDGAWRVCVSRRDRAMNIPRGDEAEQVHMDKPPNGVALKLRAPGPQAQGAEKFATYDNCRRSTATVHPPRSPASSAC